MKRATIIAAILLSTLFVDMANASSYFKLLDPKHPIIGTGFNISPKNGLSTTETTDVALITHSTADGTIVPQSWQSWLPPESWVPLQVGIGGSLQGDFVVAPGMSVNISPIIAQNLLGWIGTSSNSFLQSLKVALSGSSQGQIRLGGTFLGTLVKGGTWQSPAQAFPGRGFLDIVGNAARLNFGVAWKF